MLFNKKKKVQPKTLKDDSYLAIDIGTEFVKVALFTLEGGEVNILGYAKTGQKESAMHNAFIIDLAQVLDKVDVTIGTAVQNALETTGTKYFPKRTVMGIAGELVKGVSILVDVQRENEELKITEEELKGIVDQVSEHTFKHSIFDIAEDLGVQASSLMEIDITVNSVYIDDVKAVNPIGMKGSNLTYRVFSTFAPKVHFSTIKTIAEELNLKLERVVVEPYALATSIKEMQKQNHSAIVVDIGGGTTDIAVVKNGEVLGTQMFAIGGRTFTKRIQRELNISFEEAEQIKIDYSDAKLEDNRRLTIREGMVKDVEVWLNAMQLALEEFDDIDEFPPHFLICGGGSKLPEIKDGLLEYPWSQFLKFKKHPKIEFLHPYKLDSVNDQSKQAIDVSDVTPLALARTVLNN